MANQRLKLTRFDGGLSDDETFGPNNSWSEGQGIDISLSPAFMSTGPKLVKESGATIVSEVFDMVRVPGGTIFTANNGQVLKRTPGANGASGSYAAFISGAGGVRDFDYRADIDSVLLIGSTYIGEIQNASTSPAGSPSKYSQYYNISSVQTGGTYTVQSSITETGDSFTFVATTDPIYAIMVDVAATGTGNWTLTLHDAANKVIASLSTSMPVTGKQAFIFSAGNTGARVKIGQTYHVHLTNNSGSATIVTSSANSIATASYWIVANRLIDTGAYGHKTIQLGAKTYICNERYLAEWELLNTNPDGSTDKVGLYPGPLAAAGYLPNRLVFPGEIRTNGAALYNEYVAISAAIEEGSDSSSSIATKGIIFFWNGTDVFYNFALPVPQGVPNGLYSINNILYWEAGGRLYRWAGADIEMVYEFPGVDEFVQATGGPATELYLRASRNSFSSRNNKLQIGFPYQTANANIKHGIYSLGASKSFMPQAMTYDAVISTGSDSTKVAPTGTPALPTTGITCIKQFGNNTLVAWKDTVSGAITYGVDFFNNLSLGAASAAWASMWFNNSDPDKEKTPLALKIVFKASLPAGVTVTPRVIYDDGTWKAGDVAATAGMREIVMTLDPQNRFYEMRFGFTVTSSAGNKPRIRSLTLKFDDNREDDQDTEVQRV